MNIIQRCEYKNYQEKYFTSGLDHSIFDIDSLGIILSYVYNIEEGDLKETNFSDSSYICNTYTLGRINKEDNNKYDYIYCGMCCKHNGNSYEDGYLLLFECNRTNATQPEVIGMNAYKIHTDALYEMKDLNEPFIRLIYKDSGISLIGPIRGYSKFILPQQSTFLEGIHQDVIPDEFYGELTIQNYNSGYFK